MPGRPAHCRRLQRRTNRRHVAGGPPSTSENASVEPGDLNASGNTTFSVHVVYFAATTADQYHGTATVVTDDGGPPPPPPPVRSTEWNIRYHGTCCERNLSTSGGDTYPLLPVLVQGNKSRKNSDGRRTWAEIYPPAPASFPYGIEGDMQAFGDDVIFFETELATAVVAHDQQLRYWPDQIEVRQHAQHTGSARRTTVTARRSLVRSAAARVSR
jgi:hypothetical protein